MGEFGHAGIIAHNICVDSWGAGPFVIRDGEGVTYRFEDSDRFGPTLIKLNGDFKKRQPRSRSHFWAAHRAWVDQGRRLEDDGVTCIIGAEKVLQLRQENPNAHQT